MKNLHFLLIIFPAQGHVNPALQFTKRLINLGAHVTITVSVSARARIPESLAATPGLSIATFSDGYDNGFKPDDINIQHFLSELRQHGSQALTDLITTSNSIGNCPITCLLYTLGLSWAAEVAHGLHVPSALLWIQPATVFDIYYYYFNGYGDVIKSAGKLDCPSSRVELPGLPLLFTSYDLPSYLLPSNPYLYALRSFKEQFETLEKDTNPRILVNTFDSLEHEALRSTNHRFNLVSIGPLVGCEEKSSSTSPNDYIEWLDSKPNSSIIYLSFGSISVLEKKQSEEIGRALLDCGRPFLWVIRDDDKDKKEEGKETLSCMEELEQQGRIVTWCSQVEVLSHPSLGCFLTHCGWNSTTESLVCGVPVVAFPQWNDQWTNAKMIEDVWKSGVRVKANEEGGVVESDEILRCLELVMGEGERGEEIRKNAKKWKELAKEAVQDGGSSDLNLKGFVDGFR